MAPDQRRDSSHSNQMMRPYSLFIEFCSRAPDPSNPRVLILEMVICPFERDGAKSRLDSDQPTLSLNCPFNQGPRSFEPEGANPGDDSDQPTLSLICPFNQGPRSFEPEGANPVDGDLAPDPSNPKVLILEMVICPFERVGAKSRLDSDQPTLSLICPFNQGPRSFKPEGANLGDGDLAPDPSNPRVRILEMVICPLERDGAKSRLDSDQPTLSLICPFYQGPRSFEPEGANPGDGDLSIRTRWCQTEGALFSMSLNR
ncbi:hypothetical protein GQ457_15G021950 [Hibiscus cannabinus]